MKVKINIMNDRESCKRRKRKYINYLCKKEEEENRATDHEGRMKLITETEELNRTIRLQANQSVLPMLAVDDYCVLFLYSG